MWCQSGYTRRFGVPFCVPRFKFRLAVGCWQRLPGMIDQQVLLGAYFGLLGFIGIYV